MRLSSMELLLWSRSSLYALNLTYLVVAMCCSTPTLPLPQFPLTRTPSPSLHSQVIDLAEFSDLSRALLPCHQSPRAPRTAEATARLLCADLILETALQS